MEKLMFDYRSLGEDLAVPSEVVRQFEREASSEFPSDNMLMEIHILRAVKTYAAAKKRAASVVAPPRPNIC